MAIQKTLLIGNGLNRTTKTEANDPFGIAPIAWDDLLGKLADYANLDIQNIAEKPLTLVFDEILLKTNETDKTKHDLQTYLGNLINRSCNSALDEVIYPLTKNVLTTNYSTRHAMNFDRTWPAFLEKNFVNENTFSLFRYFATQKDRRLWYINGAAHTPTSLTLGYKQYARYQAQIKNYLTSGVEFSKGKTRSQLFQKDPVFDFDKTGEPYSWVDLYLRDHIHVIGLSMDYTESILWWLLTEKMYFKQTHPKKVGGMTYYQINIDGRPAKGPEANKLNMLADLGVIIKNVDADSYLSGYLDIAESFKKGSKDRYFKALSKQ